MIDLKGKRVLVTGGFGFLGRHVVGRLQERGVDRRDIFLSAHLVGKYEVNSVYADLAIEESVSDLFRWARPNLVVHLAAVVGGIGANQAEPGRFFHDNILMGVHVMEAARLGGVEKYLQVGTVCSYPKVTPTPFKEESLWDGYPEETNAPYGVAKRALLVMAQAYRKQYDLNAVTVVPVNLYGPGDYADLARSHVIPALIWKFLEAKKTGAPSVTVWGTGKATREFLYVEDAADGIVEALAKYDYAQPVNLGSGEEISIASLAELIGTLTQFEGKIEFDATKPDGQPRRVLDTSRALSAFGWRAKTPFVDGLRKTIDSMRG